MTNACKWFPFYRISSKELFEILFCYDVRSILLRRKSLLEVCQTRLLCPQPFPLMVSSPLLPFCKRPTVSLQCCLTMQIAAPAGTLRRTGWRIHIAILWIEKRLCTDSIEFEYWTTSSLYIIRAYSFLSTRRKVPAFQDPATDSPSPSKCTICRDPSWRLRDSAFATSSTFSGTVSRQNCWNTVYPPL